MCSGIRRCCPKSPEPAVHGASESQCDEIRIPRIIQARDTPGKLSFHEAPRGSQVPAQADPRPVVHGAGAAEDADDEGEQVEGEAGEKEGASRPFPLQEQLIESHGKGAGDGEKEDETPATAVSAFCFAEIQ
jgi:hypothetical protein